MINNLLMINKNSKIKHDALIVKSHPHIVKKRKEK